MKNKSLPPAPKPGQPVTVSLDDLPAWLALHDLEIAGYDKAGACIIVKCSSRKNHIVHFIRAIASLVGWAVENRRSCEKHAT